MMAKRKAAAALGRVPQGRSLVCIRFVTYKLFRALPLLSPIAPPCTWKQRAGNANAYRFAPPTPSPPPPLPPRVVDRVSAHVALQTKASNARKVGRVNFLLCVGLLGRYEEWERGPTRSGQCCISTPLNVCFVSDAPSKRHTAVLLRRQQGQGDPAM